MHEDVLSFAQMCAQEDGRMLQAGMHFRSGGTYSVLLMSTRRNAPYPDEFAESGSVLYYVGHDTPARIGIDPKRVDQPRMTLNGRLTQNGKFFAAAIAHRDEGAEAERVHVYEKLRDGVWSDNGWFLLVDAEQVPEGERQIFRFKLQAVADPGELPSDVVLYDRRRIVRTAVKLEVWQRDKGRCVQCGSSENLHFDHIIPWSLGGASDTAENIQLLCSRHNLQKGARIE